VTKQETVELVIGVLFLVVVVGGLLWVLPKMVRVSTWDVAPLTFVSGTEYNIGEAGQVIVEARYANGTSALQGCEMTIWYPNKGVYVVENATFGPNGNQYIEFTVPNVTGVFEYQAICTLEGNRTGVLSKSFHVSEFQNDTSTKLNRVRAVVK
jgi:hypothetical protein